jgi:hypothetical protein
MVGTRHALVPREKRLTIRYTEDEEHFLDSIRGSRSRADAMRHLLAQERTRTRRSTTSSAAAGSMTTLPTSTGGSRG